MHVYIYDDYLDKNKYNRAINRLEIRLTDLGLNGKIIRLGGIKNIRGAIQNEIKIGAKTIVAVGNNQTVNKIIGAIIDGGPYSDFRKKTLLGIVPIGDDNSIAASFGIKDIEEACNILLARRIEKIDLGLVNKHYFLNHVSAPSQSSELEVNGCLFKTDVRGEIKIINLSSDRTGKQKSNPHDGQLDIYIRTKKRDETHLRTETCRLINSAGGIIVDDVVEIKSPAEIRIAKDQVNIIVGRDRSFD